MTLPVSPPVVPASCLVGPSRVVAVACVAWLLLIGACDAADDAPVDGAITADAGQRVDGGETPETAPDAGVLVDAGGLLPPLPACSIATSATREVCVDDGERCEIKFNDRSGCEAACASVRRVCVASYDDVDGSCAPQLDVPLSCADTGHITDYCVCDAAAAPPDDTPGDGTSDAGTPDAGTPDAGTPDVTPDAGTPPDAGPSSLDPFRAFPEAEGYGALALTTCDRRRTEVVAVTNLNDSGVGSLRAALTGGEANTYRIVIFQVGGTIRLRSSIVIRRSCLYVAGQSARGQGIQVRYDASLAPTALGNLISGNATGGIHDVVLRYMRLRSGRGDPETSGDNISFRSGRELVLDHLSGAFGNDECFSVSTASTGEPVENVTVSRNMMTAPLATHAVGSIIGRSSSDGAVATGFSVHHNFYAHMTHRAPMLQSSGRSQVISNLIYNWTSRVSRIHGETFAEVLHNSMVAGPRALRLTFSRFYKFSGEGVPRVRFDGNIAEGYGPVGWEEYVDDSRHPTLTLVPRARHEHTEVLAPPVPVTITPSSLTRENVLADVGANATLACDGRWVPFTDALDAWTIQSLADLTGPIGDPTSYDHPDDYGGFPVINGGPACADADGDGMPDAWEARYGLRANDASDALIDSDGDGYLNLEEYLNGSIPR